MEVLAKLYNQHFEEGEQQALSGLDELYMGENDVAGDVGNAEMIYGQIETQNEALRKSKYHRDSKGIDGTYLLNILEEIVIKEERL